MTVAVLVASNNQVSETFVRRHIDMLGENCIVIHGGSTPFRMDGFEPSITHKLAYRAKKVLGIANDYYDYTLAHLLKSQNVTCCFAEFGPIGVGAMNACEKLGIDLIVHFHGYDAFKYDVIDHYKDKYARLFTFAKSVISVSTSMTEQLVSLGCNPDKIKYLPCLPYNGFSNHQYQNSGQHLLTVGRFVEKKAPWLTLLAFQKVLQQCPDASLTMVGDGPLLPVCKSLCDDLAIPNVRFLGAKSHDDVATLMQEATIYVQHSVVSSDGDREGTPVSVSEAMLGGLPVVSTRHQGIADLIQDGETGFVVDEHDTSAMAAKIVTLLNDEVLRLTLSVAAKQSIEALKQMIGEEAYFASLRQQHA